MGFAGVAEEQSEFHAKVAEARHLLQEGRLAETSDRERVLSELRQLTSSSIQEDQALALAVRFEVGRQTHDDELLHGAMVDLLHDHSTQFMNAFVGNLSNLSFLGDRSERWAILRQFASLVIPDRSDPAIRFIDEGRPSDLEELTKAGWAPASAIAAPLDVEIRLQVAWKALDVAREYPLAARVKSLLISDFFKQVNRAQKRAWEVGAIKAITYLVSGEPEQAVVTLKNLRIPQWGVRYLCREIHRFAPFALGSRMKWIETLGCAVRVAPDTVEDALVFKALDLLEAPAMIGPQRIHELTIHPEFPAWVAPLVLSENGLSEPSVKTLVKWIADLHDEQVRLLPWKHCGTPLARRLADIAIRGGSERVDAVRCLLAFHLQLPDDEIGRETVRALDSMSRVEQLITLTTWSALVDHKLVSRLPDRVQLALARGTYRAVVDGSNVMFGGLAKVHGHDPGLDRLVSAIRSLRDHGFEVIQVYVDQSIGRQLPTDRFNQMIRNGEVTQIDYADPQLIDDYLQQPIVSEIVSNDTFRSLNEDKRHRDRLSRLRDVGLRSRKTWAQQSDILFTPSLREKAPLLTDRELQELWAKGPKK